MKSILHPRLKSLSQEGLKAVLDYNLESGLFHWRTYTSGQIRAGDVAGGLSAFGYVRVKINGKRYMAHRLAWLYIHGNWPQGDIDHINGDKTDNRIANLRDVPAVTNQQNRRAATKRNATGFLGVSARSDRQGFRAQIYVNKRQVFLGNFDTAESAHAAYLLAKRSLHEGCSI